MSKFARDADGKKSKFLSDLGGFNSPTYRLGVQHATARQSPTLCIRNGLEKLTRGDRLTESVEGKANSQKADVSGPLDDSARRLLQTGTW